MDERIRVEREIERGREGGREKGGGREGGKEDPLFCLEASLDYLMFDL